MKNKNIHDNFNNQAIEIRDDKDFTGDEFHINDHISHLRSLVISCFIVFIFNFITFYIFIDNILDYISYYLKQSKLNTITTGVMDIFFIKLKTAFIASLIGSIPIVLGFIYFYLKLACTKKELRYIKLIIFWIIATIIISIPINNIYLFPYIMDYMISMNIDNNNHLISMGSYLSVFNITLFATMISLQMPLIVYFIIMAFGYNKIAEYRRIFIVSCFVVAAIITPPDPLSQILFASFCIVIFELTMLFARCLRMIFNYK